ncbi:MAG TPA: hypothetical protein VGI85_15655 [Chthoniobacterales bacterium]|jgi:hypothetical protein
MSRIITAIALVFLFSSPRPGRAERKPSAELARALAAAERARTLPKGAAYVEAVQHAIGRAMQENMGDCFGHFLGWRQPEGFDSVLIIGSAGKLKWIIRDLREPTSACFFSKLIKVQFPPPPADNWPVRFSIHSRH